MQDVKTKRRFDCEIGVLCEDVLQLYHINCGRSGEAMGVRMHMKYSCLTCSLKRHVSPDCF